MENLITSVSEKQIFDLLGRQSGTLFLYIFTPLCGTCKLAEQMLQIAISTENSSVVYKTDANFTPKLIEAFKVQSVPCLLVFENGNLVDKHYAFKSVQDVYEIIKAER
jgi:thioredoxin-like negative regulator of GroEL